MVGTIRVYRLIPIPSISVQVPSVYPVYSMLALAYASVDIASILLALAQRAFSKV